jgi:phosphatidylglycerol:prolipoprotein diacylglycerol transferase
MYGLMLAASFLLGVLYVHRMTRRDNRDFEPYIIISYLFIIGGIVGARIAYIVLHLDEFAGNWGSAFNPFASETFGIAGLNLYGGILLGIVASFVYCRWKKLDVLDVFDYFAPTVGIGLLFTRIGCFCNGCCFGTPTDLPWGITFPAGSIPFWQFGDQHLHPAQLYSSAYGLLLFLLLHFMLRNRRFVGQIVGTLFMIEAAFRFAIEYVRYYEDAMLFSLGDTVITFNQVISIALFVLGLATVLIQRKRSRLVPQDSGAG